MSAAALSRQSEWPAVISSLIVGTLGAAVLLILPGLVGVLHEGYRFSDAQVGYLSSAALGGLTLGAAVGARLVPALGVTRSARISILLAAAAQFAMVPVHAFTPLLILLVLGGLGSGAMVTVSYVVLGQTQSVERNFGLFVIGQLLFGAAAMPVMPMIASVAGVGGTFILLGALFLAALLLLRYLSVSPSAAPAVTSATLAGAAAGGLAIAAIVAVFFYSVALGAVWAYLQLIGEGGGLTPQDAASGVAIATLVGVSGPIAATALGARFGRVVPLFAGTFLGVAAMYMLTVSPSGVAFIIAASAFCAAWNFTVPYQLACVALVDASGRAIGWAAPVSLAGLALGPFGATFVLEGRKFAVVLWLCVALSLVSLLGFLPACLKSSTAQGRATAVSGSSAP